MLGHTGLGGTDRRRVGGEKPEDLLVAQAAPVEKGRGESSSARMRLQSSTHASQM